MYLTDLRALNKLKETNVFEYEGGGKFYHQIDGALHNRPNPDGSFIRKKWYYDGVLHNLSGPAIVWYNKSGGIIREEWYMDNKCFRHNGPSNIYYYESGVKKREEWRSGKYVFEVRKYYPNGNIMVQQYGCKPFTSYSKPSLTFFDEQGNIEREEWYFNGKLLRESEYLN